MALPVLSKITREEADGLVTLFGSLVPDRIEYPLRGRRIFPALSLVADEDEEGAVGVLLAFRELAKVVVETWREQKLTKT